MSGMPRKIAVGAALIISWAFVAWSTWTVASRPDPPLHAATEPTVVTVDVEMRRLESAVVGNASVEWSDRHTHALAGHWSAGVVTRGVEEGEPLTFGAALFEIDLTPVFLLPGEVPSFRDINSTTVGRDVVELRAALTSLGLLDSRSVDEPEVFDDDVAQAVARLYVKAGYMPPTERPIPSSQLTQLRALWSQVETNKSDQVDRVVDVIYAFGPYLPASQFLVVESAGERLGAPISIGQNASGVEVISTGRNQIARLSLDRNAVGLLAVGATAVLNTPDGAVHPAEVTWISPTVDSETGRFWVEATLDRSDSALEGQPARVSIVVETTGSNDVLVAPVSAITESLAGQPRVLILTDDGAIRESEVRLGLSVAPFVEVLESSIPLEPGTRLVIAAGVRREPEE